MKRTYWNWDVVWLNILKPCELFVYADEHLKTPQLPAAHRVGDALKDIAKSRPECLSETEIVKIWRKINKARLIYDNDLGKEHVDNIDDLTGKGRIYS